jgi:lipid II:glycine glycyltransferase (peptidoglycan interpeptide bridge formation enzyme)
LGPISIKSREEFVQPNQFNSRVSGRKEIKSNTDSYYTNNNLSYRNDGHTPLYILDLGEEKDKAPEKVTDDIFGSLDII